MKTRKLLLTLILTLVCTQVASALDLDGKFGQGYGQTRGKIIEARVTLSEGFVRPLFAAGVLNAGNIRGGTYNLYYSGAIELFVENKAGFYLGVSQGMAVLARETSRLDSRLQFPTELRGGLTFGGKRVGLFWKHFSSGRASSKNRGQEYVGLDFGFNF